MVSDHGFKAWAQNRYWYYLNPLFEELGLLKYLRSSVPPKRRFKNFIKKRFPFIVKLYKKARGFDPIITLEDELDQFKDRKIAWSKTSIYDKSFNPEIIRRLVSLNIIGREEFGIISPAEKNKKLKELVKLLSDIKTIEGRPIFDFIRPASREGIDIICKMNESNEIYNDNLMINGKTIPVNKYYEKMPLSGHHKIEGFAVYSGPDFKKNEQMINLSVMDVTPLILTLYGFPIAKDMKGKVRRTWFKTPPEIKFIDSYETEKRSSKISEGETDEEVRKKLRALGYIS